MKISRYLHEDKPYCRGNCIIDLVQNFIAVEALYVSSEFLYCNMNDNQSDYSSNKDFAGHVMLTLERPAMTSIAEAFILKTEVHNLDSALIWRSISNHLGCMADISACHHLLVLCLPLPWPLHDKYC